MKVIDGNEGDVLKAEVFSTGMFVRPSRVLLVSHDMFELATLGRMLADAHAVDTSQNAEEAWATAVESRPDMIIIDCALPHNSGFELCRRMKEATEFQDTAIVLMLDSSNAQAHARALDCGTTDIFRKPHDKMLLLARIKSLLKYKSAVAALRKARNELEKRVEERTAELQKEIADHKRTEAALKESQARFALAAEGSNDGLWDWDLRTGKVYYSPRWKDMLGYSEDTQWDSPDHWFGKVHPQDVDHVNKELSAHLDGHKQQFYCEYRIQHKNGTMRWVLTRGMAVRDDEGVPCRIAGSQSDITPRKLMELHLRHDAMHDALTGLPNRALFVDRLKQAIARSQRSTTYQFAVLLLDIDKFKLVNDSLGHSFGDHLLIEFSRRVKAIQRSTDTVGRLGGDEFVVLLEEVNGLEGANLVAQRIHDEFKAPLMIDGRQMFVTTSIGVVLGRSRYERADDVLRDADTALYQAKAAGRGRHEAFNSGMHMKVLTLLDLENELRNAVQDCSQFLLNYQPILSLENSSVIGFEALVRWNHPARGLVSPMQFIPLAEDTDLITPITYWVLETACRQFKEWERSAGQDLPLYVSINLSGRTFAQEDLASRVAEIIRKSDVDPRRIHLEITEGSLMKNPELALATLSKFKEMNIGLMVDDFGTGYSSLSYLHRLPLDVLKIDRSFIEDMQTDSRNMQIVRTMALLAERLGLKMVAEGIETEEQQRSLKAMRCQLGQGYLFSKPVSGQDALAFLKKNLKLGA
ncbi:MAG TPA: EAL domain-containing protein [Planctomycetota bacterium]|nr:EAL domain-containing protein [Planctomycetota bacterium]